MSEQSQIRANKGLALGCKAGLCRYIVSVPTLGRAVSEAQLVNNQVQCWGRVL